MSTIAHYYILSGYSKKEDLLRTNIYNTIEEVFGIVNYWHRKAGLREFDNIDAFEASVQASSKNGHAFPIDTNPLVLWNIFYV